jgi:hypothetical protein
MDGENEGTRVEFTLHRVGKNFFCQSSHRCLIVEYRLDVPAQLLTPRGGEHQPPDDRRRGAICELAHHNKLQYP